MSITLLTTKGVAQKDIDALNAAKVRGVAQDFFRLDGGHRLELNVEQDVTKLVPSQYQDRLSRRPVVALVGRECLNISEIILFIPSLAFPLSCFPSHVR